MIELSEEKKEFDVEFTISYVVYRKNDFVILKAKNLKMDEENNKSAHSQTSIKGFFPRAEVGDVYRAKCRWLYDKNYGYSLEALEVIRTLPSNINGIRMFLMKNVKGVGEKTVEKIIKAFGESSLDKIREGELEHIKGIAKKTKERVYNKVIEAKNLENLTVFLYQRGVKNYSDVVEIYEKLGEDAESKIRANPYCICTGDKAVHFPLADNIAIHSGFDVDSILRIEMMILYFINSNMFVSGNIYENESELAENLYKMIQTMSLAYVNLTPDLIKRAVSELEKAGQIVLEPVYLEGNLIDNYIYIPSCYKKECEIAEMTKSLLAENIEINDSMFTDFIRHYEEDTGINLDDIQKNAVKNSINHKISIITGGPGTGKTLTINAIIRYILSTSPDAEIRLCAPTGKAAKRMSEMTGMEAYTIHRLLCLNNDESYIVDEGLDVDYVIVDESSMINQSLFHSLLSAVYKGGASILLVGDKDQLPPVGAGLPFKDLISCGAVPVVRLENLYRQAGESQININAKRILAGITETGNKGLQFDINKQDFFFFSAYNSDQINKLILKSVDGLKAVGVKEEDIVVLSPMKKTNVGVNYINQMLQEHLNPSDTLKNDLKMGSNVFREGDRVMQTVNNYDKWVFNGDCGRITRIDEEEEEVVIDYDDYSFRDGKLVSDPRPVTYEFSEISQITLAYSTTVHKAQGSEYPCVIMPLSPLLINTSRSILYTAVTRAKCRFVFIGDTDSLKKGIERIEELRRNTRLAERVAKGCHKIG
ncbi:MAG: ATP-dependent RecD-like DNA helicase [Lachnospiraceae bacterium]|nr:ATP-dependent RecD-like DNA helicase [Lachnospiraceae bacterium]